MDANPAEGENRVSRRGGRRGAVRKRRTPLTECSHGPMIPKTGFSRKSRRMWAAFKCRDKNPACSPEPISEAEVFDYWLEGATANKTAVADCSDDSPPFEADGQWQTSGTTRLSSYKWFLCNILATKRLSRYTRFLSVC